MWYVLIAMPAGIVAFVYALFRARRILGPEIVREHTELYNRKRVLVFVPAVFLLLALGCTVLAHWGDGELRRAALAIAGMCCVVAPASAGLDDWQQFKHLRGKVAGHGKALAVVCFSGTFSWSLVAAGIYEVLYQWYAR